jgi:hypothetical protein
MFFSFLAIIQVPQCAFLIFQVFECFLAIFQVKQCLCLIFHVFQFSRHIPGPTVYFSFFKFFSVSSHVSCSTVCVSHFP